MSFPDKNVEWNGTKRVKMGSSLLKIAEKIIKFVYNSINI